MKLKSATAIVVSSLTLLAASLAVAQQQPSQPTVPRPGSALPATGLRGVRPFVVPPAATPGARAPNAPQPTPAQPAPAQPAPAPGPAEPIPPPASANAPSSGGGGRAGGLGGPGGPGGALGGPGGAGGQTPTNITQVAGGQGMHEFEGGIDYTPLPPGARITFNLQDADLPDLIRAIGNITGKRFILPGKIRSIKTTIYSPTKITPGEAYNAFLSALQSNGLTVTPSGRYFTIQETPAIQGNPLPTFSPGEGTPTTDQYFTRVHRLRNMTADDAAAVLGHFKSHDGDVTPYAATNTVIITDTGANIRRMMQILSDVDVPAVGEQIWVERLHYASATDLAQRITELLNGGGGGGGGGGRPPGAPGAAPASDVRLTRITPDERSNSLIIVATERMYLRVLELIRRLDVPVEGEGDVQVYYLQHADAEELANTLNQITGGGRGGVGGPAPQGGQAGGPRGPSSVFEGPVRITADKRTNALVITSSPRDFVGIRHVINELDRARRQVFIEAVVMELSVSNSNKLGVSWHSGFQPTGDTLGLGGFQAVNSVGFPGSLATNQDALSGLALGVRGPYLPGTQNLIPGLTLGIPAFGAVITALANSGDADVLGTPSIIATDNSPADINVGENIPLQTGLGGITPGATGAAGSTGFPSFGLGFGGFAAPRQDVGTKIHIVPHINDSNEIRLEIEEEISEVGASNQGALGAVSINKRNAKTTVVVQDQQTVVIGGLIRNAITRSNTRIPILGDLPLIGVLFRQEERTIGRRNLLLFLTPYVIRDQTDLRRIFERKMRERQEFLDRYFVFSESQEYHPVIDWSRTNGMVEEIRQAIREQRVQAEIEGRALPRPPPPHVISQPIELPAEVRPAGGVVDGAGQAPPQTEAPPEVRGRPPAPTAAPVRAVPAGGGGPTAQPP